MPTPIVEADNVPVQATVLPQGLDSGGGEHAVALAEHLQGVLQSVADRTARDAFIADAVTAVGAGALPKARTGMLFYIQDLDVFDFLADADEANDFATVVWTEGLEFHKGSAVSDFDAAARTYYFSPTSGDDDTGDGSLGNPWQTPQRTVNAFFDPFAGIPTWDLGDDRYAICIDGDGDVVGDVVCPAHAGPGFLIIRGQMTTVASGLEIASFASIANQDCQSTVNFTTAPLTPADPNIEEVAFLTPATQVAPNVSEQSWENMPIITNAAGSCVVAAYQPNASSVYYTTPGTVCDIVRPTIQWVPKQNDENAFGFAFSLQGLIKNPSGSPLVVEGFVFKQDDTQFIPTAVPLVSYSEGTSAFGSDVAMTLCRIAAGANATFAGLAHGSGINLSGLNVDSDKSAVELLNGAQNIVFMNTRIKADAVTFKESRFTSFGMDFAPNQGAQTTCGFVGCQLYFCSLASNGVVFNFSLGSISAETNVITVINTSTGNPAAVLITDNSYVHMNVGGLLKGATGNYLGVHVRYGGRLGLYSAASHTLTGSAGNLKVGPTANPTQTYVAGSSFDLTEAAAYQVRT